MHGTWKSVAVCTSVLLLALALPGQGPGPKWSKSWKECLEQAKTQSKPILVCFTALQWDPASADFLKKVIQDEAVALAIDATYVPIHFDLILKPDRKFPPEVANQGRELAKKFGFHGVHCVPRVILVTREERVYGRVGPVGAAEEFLRWLREWEEARLATEKPPVDAAEADRCAREASAARSLKNPTKALDWARQAVAANPASPYAHHVLGLILQDLGQDAESRKHYLAALAIDSTGNPRDATSTIWAAGSWYNLGVLASREKKQDGMAFCWRENQRTDWRTNGPVEQMISIHTQLSKEEACLLEFEEMMSRAPFSPHWMERYQSLYDTLGKGK